jgi:hypothetical protein
VLVHELRNIFLFLVFDRHNNGYCMGFRGVHGLGTCLKRYMTVFATMVRTELA